MDEHLVSPAAFPLARPEEQSHRGFTVEMVIKAWLNQKEQLSGSVKTVTAYNATIRQFRALLQHVNRDLIYQGDLFHVEIADAAQMFSQWRSPKSRRAGPVTPATRQHRLAIISSFYDYALKHRHIAGGNPLDITERPKVEAYAASAAIAPDELAVVLAGIDTTTLLGKRDKAALLVFLTTGRRVSEVAALTRSQVKRVGAQLELHFSRTKGGKSIDDLLSIEVSEILSEWLEACYEVSFAEIPEDAPLWVDLRHPSRRDQALGYDGFSGICEKYLGTSKVHTLRGSFTILMLLSDAKLHEIQYRLQHENAATTGMYAGKLRQGVNPYAGALAEKLGLKKARRECADH
jgi:site-specific recombinase XerD